MLIGMLPVLPRDLKKSAVEFVMEASIFIIVLFFALSCSAQSKLCLRYDSIIVRLLKSLLVKSDPGTIVIMFR